VPVLDLTEHEDSGFEALDPGVYACEIFEASWAETKGGENAALPKGTPLLKVQFVVRQPEEFDNRRVFGQYTIPPKKIGNKPYEHYAKLNGMLVRFFKAIGYSEEEITQGGWEPDLEDMVGKACSVKVSRYQWPPDSDPPEFQNKVVGVKPAGEPVGTSSGSLL
jgi:hypothetical protein